jgi:hypothetical protein
MVQMEQMLSSIALDRDRHNRGWQPRSAASASAQTPRGRARRGPNARMRIALTALAALVACLALASSAPAAAPVFNSSFTCDVDTPCGAITSGFAPGRLAVDNTTGNVYVIDEAHDAVVVFDSAGVYQSTIAGSSTTRGSFGFGGGEDELAIDNSGGANQGRLYVMSEGATLSSGNVGIFAFRPDGGFLWEANPGGGLADVCGIDVNPSGIPYEADWGFGVRPLSPTDGSVTGPPIDSAGTQCELAFDSTAAFYIRNFNAGSVEKRRADGSLSGIIDDGSSGANLDPATDLTSNNVYLARAADVAVYDSSGNAISGTPFGAAELTGGSGIGVAVNGAASKVYVSDSGHAQIHIYDLPAVVRHTLTVTVNGTGSGRVDADSGLIAGCTRSAGTCTDTYEEGSVVRLTATPRNATVSWSGGGCAASGTSCDVTMSADQNVTVTFDQRMPTVSGESSSGITQTGATVAGSVTPNGAATTCNVESGTTTAYGTSTAITPAPGSGTSAVAVRAALSGLTPNTDYHWRLSCSNAGGTTNGSDQTFRTTAAPAPAATTGAASGVTQTGATLAGTVNPNGFATTCRFEYGTTAAYGSSVACAAAPGSGSSAVGVSAAVAGLTPGTTYHYRLVASSVGGTANGADATFTTQSATPTTGTLTVNSSSVTVRRGKAPIRVTCSGGPCRGTLTLTARIRRGRKTTTATIGRASFDLAAGASATLTVKLSGPAKSALARKPHKLKASASGAGVTTKNVTLKQRAKKKKKHKKK